MEQQEQQLIDRIKQAQNILVTVSSNPSVDQLAAAIGLTVALNKMNKHGTAVFSGQVPSTIDFLKPENTLEKNTDSLRDFIIALDKSKADKLRYKVEDQVVRIFITPYRTSLSQDDLEFSQGDFNVDVVVALGVTDQKDIDAAIVAHGRILHDATVASVSIVGKGDFGTINWLDTTASSLSEMMLSFIDGLDKKLLDNQIATALLTGIVASTDRFRNEKTSPKAMSASAELMAAGANQQLIATELETPPTPLASEPVPDAGSYEPSEQETVKRPEPGELDIDHRQDKQSSQEGATKPDSSTLQVPEPEKDSESSESVRPQIHVDENGLLTAASNAPLPTISQVHGVEPEGVGEEQEAAEVHHERMTMPPSLGDVNMTANTSPEDLEPPAEELTLPAVSAPLLTHNETVLPPAPTAIIKPTEDPFIPQAPLTPIPQGWQPPSLTSTSSLPPSTPVGSSFISPAPTVISPMVPSPNANTGNPLSSASFPQAVPMPGPVASPISPASASLIPNETLEEIEEAVHSSHLQQDSSAKSDSSPVDHLEDARNAVQAAFGSAPTNNETLPPIAALNAQPLGPELHGSNPVVSNVGFSEPTPGNTPADATLDMPLPSNPFGPGQSASTLASPSVFPGLPPEQGNSNGVPPVPPPFVPPAV